MATRTWTSQRAGTSGNQWSKPSNVSTSPWYDAGTQAAFADYPGSNPSTNLDVVTLQHAVTLDVAVTLGLSLQGCQWQGPSPVGYSSSTGSATTNLATGTYRLLYTTVSTNGESGVGIQGVLTASDLSLGTVTNGTTKPRITFPAGPPAGCTYNVYLTNTGGTSGTEKLYCTGCTGTTLDLVGASWGNTYSAGVASGGSTTFASATSPPSGTACFALVQTSAGTLTPAANLTLRGDSSWDSSAIGTSNQTIFPAGTSLIYDPSIAVVPASAGYCHSFAANLHSPQLVFNGTQGSPCAMQTYRPAGTEAAAIMLTSNSGVGRQGVITATWTNFTDLGNSKSLGVQTLNSSTGSDTWSITNCTFTRCNFFSQFTGAWDGTHVFSNNTLTSSIGITILSFVNQCGGIQFTNAASTGTRTMAGNSIDLGWMVQKPDSLYIGPNNYFANNCNAVAGGTWTAFDSNFVELAGDIFAQGPFTNNFVFFNHSGGTNEQMIAGEAIEPSTLNITGNIYYHNGNNVGGEFLNYLATVPTGAVTVNLGFNIGLPNGTNGKSSGSLMQCGANGTNLTVNVYHNTVNVDGGAALVQFGSGQTVIESPNRWALVEANLPWGTLSNGLKANDQQAGQTLQDILPPSVADYNGGFDLATGSGTNGGNGYTGNFSVTPGTHDVSANPNFVNSSASLATWSTTQGGAGTDASAVALIQANPALITQAGTGLIPWIRANYRTLQTSYKAASYPGDPSSTDAAGNAWLGAGPDIGAMAFQASNVTLAADPGSFTLTGIAAKFGITLKAQPGAFTLTGLPATLTNSTPTPTPTPTPSPTPTGGSLLLVSGVPTAVNVAGQSYGIKTS